MLPALTQKPFNVTSRSSNQIDSSEETDYDNASLSQPSIDNQLLGSIRNVSVTSLNPSSNAKQRLLALEEAIAAQSQINEGTAGLLEQLSDASARRDKELKSLLPIIKESYTAEILALRKEFDHRFDLQRAENKRLEETLLNVRRESAQTIERLTLTIKQLLHLQMEFGDYDESDEFGLMASSLLQTKPKKSKASA